MSHNSSTLKLRDYQEKGVEVLRDRKRVMLTDAPGLGKTPQTTFAAECPVIISAPAYLVPVWEAFLKGEDKNSLIRNNGVVIPNVDGNIGVAKGTRKQRQEVLDNTYDFQWLVTNHEMLDGYEEFKNSKWRKYWRSGIIDESHHLKAHNGKRAKIAVPFFRDMEYVFEATATPAKREIDDFFMQLRILQPDVFTSYWRFVNTFCRTESTYFGTKILGTKKSMRHEFEQILSLMTFGRSYETAGRELPPVIEEVIPVYLNPQVRKLYNDIIELWRVKDEEEELTFTNYKAAEHTIRQHLTGALKAPVVASLVEDLEEGKKAVIFSWYKETAEAIQQKIGEDKCELVTGNFKREERNIRAQGDKHVSATIASIGEGIDLSDARILIFAEEDYTPGTNYQGFSRVVRERQNGDNSEPVLVYYIMCENTIDESIHDVALRRGGTIKEVVKHALYQVKKVQE